MHDFLYLWDSCLRTRQTDLILNLHDKYEHETQSYRKSYVFHFLVILNCILLYTHVYWALSNSIYYNFPQLDEELDCLNWNVIIRMMHFW